MMPPIAHWKKNGSPCLLSSAERVDRHGAQRSHDADQEVRAEGACRCERCVPHARVATQRLYGCGAVMIALSSTWVSRRQLACGDGGSAAQRRQPRSFIRPAKN